MSNHYHVVLSDPECRVAEFYGWLHKYVAKAVNASVGWPGVWLYKKSHSKTIKRPEIYFRSNGEMPDKIKLKVEPPPQFDRLSAKQYEQLVQEKVQDKERKIGRDMSAKKLVFMGVQLVMKQRHTSKPKSVETRRELNPSVAGKNKWLRLETLQRLKEFLYKYKDAFKRWRQGERNVVFPAGTYALRVFAGVKCEPG